MKTATTWTLGTRIRSRFSLARERIERFQNIVAELKTHGPSEATSAASDSGIAPALRGGAMANSGIAPALRGGAMANVHRQSDGALQILIVEDEKYLANSLELILAEHRVTVARNGREAVALCAEREYDVILCDLWMHDLTGMDVHRELLRHRPGQEQRMVFMTGGAFTRRAQQFLDSVPNPVLQKPFSTEELLRAVAGGRRGSDLAPAS